MKSGEWERGEEGKPLEIAVEWGGEGAGEVGEG